MCTVALSYYSRLCPNRQALFLFLRVLTLGGGQRQQRSTAQHRAGSSAGVAGGGDLAVLFLAALADFVVVSVCLVVVSFAVVGFVGPTGSVGAAGSVGCTGSVGPSGFVGGWGSVGPSGSVGGSGSPVPGTVRVTVCRLWLSPKGPGSKRKPASSSWAAV